jgi:antitoxin (DNA-binding transcriptional repressor) of toxin-antitoxin stability system
MPEQVSNLNIQNDIFQLLDKVIKTGVPVEIERKGKRLLISPAEKRRDLDSLEEHPEFIVGNPDDLVHIDWSAEWKPQL